MEKKTPSSVLVIDNKNVECIRGHSKFFNHRIKGTNKRFCIYIIGVTMPNKEYNNAQCGDIPDEIILPGGDDKRYKSQ